MTGDEARLNGGNTFPNADQGFGLVVAAYSLEVLHCVPRVVMRLFVRVCV